MTQTMYISLFSPFLLLFFLESFVLDVAPSSVFWASATARTYCRAFSRSEGSSDLKLTSICAALCVTVPLICLPTFFEVVVEEQGQSY